MGPSRKRAGGLCGGFGGEEDGGCEGDIDARGGAGYYGWGLVVVYHMGWGSLGVGRVLVTNIT